MHINVLRFVGFVHDVIELLTIMLLLSSLLGFQHRDSQFAYRWCHSPIASSWSATHFRPIPHHSHYTIGGCHMVPVHVLCRHKRLYPRRHSSIEDNTATNWPTAMSLYRSNDGNALTRPLAISCPTFWDIKVVTVIPPSRVREVVRDLC